MEAAISVQRLIPGENGFKLRCYVKLCNVMFDQHESNKYREVAVGCGMQSKMFTPLMFCYSGHVAGGTRSNCFFFSY